MRWGVIRYQNPDGTLTEGGKARYNSDGSKKRAHEMSDEDLRKSTNRLRSEQEYNRLTGNTTRDKIFNKDMAVKLGIGVTGAVGTALLINNLNPSKIKKGKELVDNLLLVAVTTPLKSGLCLQILLDNNLDKMSCPPYNVSIHLNEHVL